ncbi:OmpA family protein [Oceanobacter mangrovi]|uniref:OmpA family protein n=1 Tax=Oceanobacter mangrovi TaxID=2862510 RepID=UPI001C8EA8B8|nr:OmpA family protein [Oceanobacter mangrovi]
MTFKPLAIAVAFAAAASAHADQGSTYITVGGGYADNEIFDDFRLDNGSHINNSWTNELSLGYYFLPALAGEVSLTLPSPFQGDKKPEITQYQLKGLYFFGENALKPYLTAGYGLEKFEVPQNNRFDEETHVFTYGLGLQYHFTESWFGRAEYHIDEMTDESNEHGVAMLEVGYLFGASKPAKPVVKEEPKPVVMPALVKEPEPVVEEVVEVVVEPLDSDNDGVIDDNDACPNTVAGASVDAKGCSVFDGKLEGVNFESGSARLTAEARGILDDAASEVAKFPNLKVEIAAYTDSQGSAAFNQRLSQSRADSVRNYLIGKGISGDQLTAVGYGEDNPIATNETAAGRATNRRVEFVVQQ